MPNKKEISKENSIAAILEAATREFAEVGYQKATTRSIAAAAGVSNGLITKYFASKEALLATIVEQDKLAKLYAGNTETDPYRIFCFYLDYVRKKQREDPVRFKLAYRMANDPDFPNSLNDVTRKSFAGSPIEKAVIQMQQAGELRQGDPLEIFKETLI